MNIDFIYINKSGECKRFSKPFSDVRKAIAFCWSMRSNPRMWLEGYSSDDLYELEYIGSKVNRYIINFGKTKGKEDR